MGYNPSKWRKCGFPWYIYTALIQWSWDSMMLRQLCLTNQPAKSHPPENIQTCSTMGKGKNILHPGRLTWNLQIITHLERKMIFQTSMIMFHVNLQGCIQTNHHVFLDLCHLSILSPPSTLKLSYITPTNSPTGVIRRHKKLHLQLGILRPLLFNFMGI